MIDLIIDTKTNTVFNSFEFSGVGQKAEDYILSWTNSESVCTFPDSFMIQEIDDFILTDRLPPKDGYRTEFRYDLDAEKVYELYIAESYLIADRISELTKELNSTDYKVIKGYEAQLAGLPVPYDFSQVHAERQAIRDKINELELLL